MKTLATTLSIALIVLPGIAFAQTASVNAAPACLLISANMRVGATDVATNGSVTALQNFLTTQGYFNSAYAGTGRFGPITFRAVVSFQSAHGLPATGYVGPMTRALISQLGCSTPTPVPPSPGPVSLFSIAPVSGTNGTVVSITGFGFSSSNTVYMDGMIAARNVPITSSIAIACTTSPGCHGGINQTIQFTVPSTLSPNCPSGGACPLYIRQVTPGIYPITVSNGNSTSYNSLSFTVLGAGSGSVPPSIQSVSAPSTLGLNQTGTWTVRVLAGTGSGNLHYSVVWGDENLYGYNSFSVSPASTVSSTGTFTHSYAQAGTYTPRFTVTDDVGRSNSAGVSVFVSPQYGSY